jgi:hypothetical protein
MEGTLKDAATAGAAGAATARKKLIFFVAADPAADAGPLDAARHFATVAGEAGLEAEIRLAVDAVRVLQTGGLEGLPESVEVTACPRSMANLALSEEQVQAAGARPRRLAEILTEVADGQSVLIPVAHRIDESTA